MLRIILKSSDYCNIYHVVIETEDYVSEVSISDLGAHDVIEVLNEIPGVEIQDDRFID